MKKFLLNSILVIFGVLSCTSCHIPHILVHHEGKEATCLEDGYKDYDTCLICDYSSYEVIPAFGHDLKLINSEDPTCTKDGYEYYECTRCDYSETVSFNKTGHDFTGQSWVIDKEANLATIICNNESTYVVVDLPTEFMDSNKTSVFYEGNSWRYSLIKSPTVFEGGVGKYTLIDERFAGAPELVATDIVSDPLKRDYRATYDWNVDDLNNVTCEVTITCANDESYLKTLSAIVSVKSHQEATCLDDEVTVYQAYLSKDKYDAVDGKNFASEFVLDGTSHYGHQFEEDPDSLVLPTLENEGSVNFVCKHNVNHIETVVLPKLNSSEYLVKNLKEADCIEEGKKNYTLLGNLADGSEYKVTFDIISEALGHEWGEWEPATGAYNWIRICKRDSNHFETSKSIEKPLV